MHICEDLYPESSAGQLSMEVDGAPISMTVGQTPVMKWKIEEVGAWLQSLHFEQKHGQPDLQAGLEAAEGKSGEDGKEESGNNEGFPFAKYRAAFAENEVDGWALANLAREELEELGVADKRGQDILLATVAGLATIRKDEYNGL